MKDDKLIVGVFGTQCVGKTTFIEDVVRNSAGRDETFRWTLYGDNYRDVISQRGLTINRDGTEECQAIIHSVLVGNILKAVDEPNLKRIIMDRTIIDSFAYTFWHYAFGNGEINPKTLEMMWEQVCRYAKLFNALVYIPLEYCDDVVVIDDKFRDTNIEYRKQIDKIMHSIFMTLTESGCPMTVVYGSRENRVKWFLEPTEHLMESRNIGKFSNIKEFSAKVLLP